MAHPSVNRLYSSGRVRILMTSVALFFLFYIVVQHSHPEHPKRKKTSPVHRSPSVLVKRTAVSSCRRCSCDCLPEMDSVLMPLAHLFNSSFSAYADCAKNHPEMNEEMKKNTVTLLSEEINLRKNVTRNYVDSIRQSIMDVRQTSSRFQKEAEKCNTGVQICEEARERAQIALATELKLSALWEQRAREFGWEDESI